MLLDTKIKKLISILESYTGKKVILQEEGKIKAELKTIKQIGAYITNRIRKFAGTASNIKLHYHSNSLLIKDLEDNYKNIFVQVFKDLEKNGFQKQGNKKINKKNYIELQDELGNLVYLPM